MNLPTVILITLGALMVYYTGMICYDMYLDQLAQANKEEDNEEAVDISGQAVEFEAIPVNKTDEQEPKKIKFENMLRAGISAEKASRMMKSIAEGNPAKGLENILYIIQDHQTATTNL